MRVIPVIDLMNGVVVRGVAGRRNEYRPIRSQLVADPQPQTAARAFEHLGLGTVYVADLDAIQFMGEEATYGTNAYQRIAEAGLRLWLDAGVGSPEAARRLRSALSSLGIEAEFVIGLESLESPRALAEMVSILGQQATIFSIDLHSGVPRTSISHWANADPVEIARQASSCGISRLIVLDLADVGMSAGTRSLDLCRKIRAALGSGVEVTAGGGVRGLTDLAALKAAGCDAALVASALHDGRLTRADLDALARGM
jgi:phosphoribosylformimino-5-aminoimidazole carboxamide ribotide isomerase